MTKFQFSKSLLIVALATCCTLLSAQFAQANDSIRLSAQLKGKEAAGEVTYMRKGKQSYLKVEIKNAKPGSSLKVTATTRKGGTFSIASVEIGKNGYGSTKSVSGRESFPELQKKDLIEVWDENKVVASGYLR